MLTGEFVFNSNNSSNYARPLTAGFVLPDGSGKCDGLLVFTHGWGNNRHDGRDFLAWAAENFNLAGISVEFRQSGCDFDPVTGRGADLPYDAGFFQVTDVLNGVREMLERFPGIDRRRVYHYGGSQGGHLALLSAIYAPDTFAAIYASCALTAITPEIAGWCGRDFSERELRIRDVANLAEYIKTPVWLDHGTADEIVPSVHTRRVFDALRAAGKTVSYRTINGGNHLLAPVTTRFEVFRKTAPEVFEVVKGSSENDFTLKTCRRITAGSGDHLLVDWGKKSGDADLLKWEE